MFKLVIVSLALSACMVSCAPADATTAGTTTTPLVKLSCVGHNPNGFFVDAKDPTIFHQCSHGQHIATFHCQPNTVFDEKEQVCVVHHSEVCPQPNGLFPVPSNPHKFLECTDGHGFIKTCSGDLIFKQGGKQCDYNDEGLTWPTDPTTAAPTKASTAAGSTGTAAGTGTTAKAGTTPSATCEGKGNRPDPDNKHAFFNCHNGKLLHQMCPEDEVFNKVTNQCE